jgi:UDP-N-acetylmuramoyl-tripeptide--D-alanyl-D-alanine ligase
MDTKSLHQIFLQSKGVTTDTRRVLAGQIFFALKGENFNGNKFSRQAIDNGAMLAIIDEPEHKLDEKYILVADVLTCLQDLAKYHRKYLGLPVIAITGTNGKTTSKELIRYVLQTLYQVEYTHGNLNNHIGVPLTLLSFSKNTEIGIVEMGANHCGEIAALCEIVTPDYGVITNIGKAHLDGFGSYEGVIKAKSEMYDFLRNNGRKVFVNSDDELLSFKAQGIESIKYGKDQNTSSNIKIDDASPYLSLQWKEKSINSQLVGEYNLYNILLAICIGEYFKIKDTDIIKAISGYKPENNRSQLSKTEKNTLVIDAYNANPSSMELSIINFLKIKAQKKLLILGDMFELGKLSKEEHRKIVDLLINNGFKNVMFVGQNFYELKNNSTNFLFFENTTNLIEYLILKNIANNTILLKASRGVQLEKVIPYL